MYKKTTLANGLRIITHQMPKRQSVALGIWINTGGRYETTSNKGISHVLEHLLFKGTKNYSCRKVKESIEGIGGSLNGFTSEELTCYLVKIPAAHWKLALSILADMVINPSLSAAELAKEKQVILEEIKMYKDLPQSYVHELLDDLLWPGQPLGAPIIGTVESVESIDRQELSLFKEKYYTPANIVISATGEINHGHLSKAAEKLFFKKNKQNKNIFLAARDEQVRPQLKILHKDTEQTHLALGFKGFCRAHPLKHALALLHIILGANMSSRLFNELREKRGLAYEIGTQVKYFADTGAFVVHAGIDNRKVNEAVAMILKELITAAQKLVSPDEFKRAKEFYLGQLKLALEDTLDYMLWIGEATAALNKTYSLNDVIKEVTKVKREDIRKAARHIFQKNKINLALIGPLKNSESDIYKELKIS